MAAVTDWHRYVMRLIGDDNAQVAAEKCGITPSSFSRWKHGQAADPRNVVLVARAYGGNVLEALVAAGFITSEEAGLQLVQFGAEEAVRSVASGVLLDELRARLAGG